MTSQLALRLSEEGMNRELGLLQAVLMVEQVLWRSSEFRFMLLSLHQ
jgi:hypothetical protein